MFSDPIFFLQ